ncbi:MAG TPA: hypothetical protein VFD60_09850, partial [Nitrososphaeraceae archaeon]|nr:hypothetical protein [Nitrososphaeraceae archaeon]
GSAVPAITKGLALVTPRLSYPSNWLIKERPYNTTGNSTIASFLSPLPQVAPTISSCHSKPNRFDVICQKKILRPHQKI